MEEEEERQNNEEGKYGGVGEAITAHRVAAKQTHYQVG
jgi:hypothetical protein